MPHTGTRFLCKVLNADWSHTGGGYPKKEIIFRDNIVFSPIRNPSEVWQSWLRREGNNGVVNLGRFNEFWRNLGNLDSRYKLHYIHIDHPSRDDELAAASELLEEELSADWSKRPGQVPKKEWDGPIPKVDWDFIYDLPMIKGRYERS